ncbi:hypothetical protein ACFOLJ_26420 [Rugamonas sp. CCM 8940]|uniref:hypothetical protein n=1 Tax=Rugamonas sp. CCM 8940 TaxID=2765359 RepID=UPI0018F2B52F|nr:hypothetical protein [Rugamonas sp. CCM 8940]MBJ7311145.1 hypothetical protein [Rugamonas sp. CCM 8940]
MREQLVELTGRAPQNGASDVRLENQNVVLPDGTTETVLVPKVYRGRARSKRAAATAPITARAATWWAAA